MSFMNTVTTSQSQSLPYNLFDSNPENGNSLKSAIGSNTAPISHQSIKSSFDVAESSKKVDNFEIELTSFDYKFNFKIVDIIWSLSSNSIIFQLKIEEHISVTATFLGRWQGQKNPQFHLESFSLKLDQKAETPIAVFLSSSLWAMLSLSDKFRVYLPKLGYDFTTSFELPLEETRILLKERQVAYRLLVIQTALKTFLPFPRIAIEGEDVENIAFCYHAIAEREFDWFANSSVIPWKASQDSLSWLPKNNEPTEFVFQPEFIIKYIFGFRIGLGYLSAKIEKAIIDNYAEVKERLLKLDGEIVEVKLRSLNGKNRIISVGVPELPSKPWTDKLQELVDLEDQLDSMLLDKYFNFASSTADGFTGDQKQALNERLDLNADIFNY